MKPTPLTDAVLNRLGVTDNRTGDAGVLRDLARSLERDRAELIEALRKCAAVLNCEPDADACAGQNARALLSRLGAE